GSAALLFLGYGSACALPVMLNAPGPGRSAAGSIATFPVCGMQKTDASFEGWGCPSVRLPPGEPVSLMHWAVVLPKAPLVRCAVAAGGLGQKFPAVPVFVTVPVESGLRVTARGARKFAGFGGQSWVVPRVLLPAEQDRPDLGPALHVALTHFGHGDAEF